MWEPGISSFGMWHSVQRVVPTLQMLAAAFEPEPFEWQAVHLESYASARVSSGE